MKNLLLILALALGFQSCSKDDNKPTPAKTTEASLLGKWDSKTSEEKEYNAANQLANTNTQTYAAGVQWEFLSDGKWNQYDQYQVVDKGTYSKQGNVITITVSGETIKEHIVSLTDKELITRDTLRRSDNTWVARLNRHTRN